MFFICVNSVLYRACDLYTELKKPFVHIQIIHIKWVIFSWWRIVQVAILTALRFSYSFFCILSYISVCLNKW